MSRENVELVRSSFEHFNRTGYLPDAAFDPDIELTNIRESPIPGPYRGHAGLRRWSDDIREVVEELRFDVKELIDADEASAVLVRLQIRGRARHTDVDIELPVTGVWWMRNGRVYRAIAFSDDSEALKAAGLSE